MKDGTRVNIMLFLTLVVAALNSWTTYIVAIHGWSAVAEDVSTIFAATAGIVAFVLAWIIVSSRRYGATSSGL